MTGARHGLDSVLADVLADLATRSLDLDPASRARLAALEGRQVQVTTELPMALGERHFALTISGGRLRFYPHPLERPNVVVRGTPPDLVAWLVAEESAARTRLTIDGDAAVLSELTGVIKAFRPALGGPLSGILGAEFAQAALGAAELALAAATSALEGAGRTVRDEAARAFVDRRQAERFLDEMDDLRLRVDRLAARVLAREQPGTAP